MLHAGDESSVGAMGRNPVTFPRRGPLKACFSPGLCPIGVGVLQACAPLKLHVISLWGPLWCVTCTEFYQPVDADDIGSTPRTLGVTRLLTDGSS